MAELDPNGDSPTKLSHRFVVVGLTNSHNGIGMGKDTSPPPYKAAKKGICFGNPIWAQ